MTKEKTIKEDELIPSLVQLDEPAEFEKERPDSIEYTAMPEVHYNYYGSRGCVDLITRKETTLNGSKTVRDSIYEVKSDSAIRNATGANEILRQFNKHKKYLYKDPSQPNVDRKHFELVFIPTLTTVKHVLDNSEIYSAAADSLGRDEFIHFRTCSTEDHQPVAVVSNSSSFPSFNEPYKLASNLMERDTTSARQLVDKLESLLNDD